LTNTVLPTKEGSGDSLRREISKFGKALARVAGCSHTKEMAIAAASKTVVANLGLIIG
jgi:hypothetical protein